MRAKTHSILFFSLLVFTNIILPTAAAAASASDSDPTASPWPVQFHSILFMNRSGTLQHVDLWYDWPNGRNFNILQDQLGKLTYDLEWTNGTSFIYTLDSNKECRVLSVGVGILTPNWMDGANYLGQKYMDGFLCNVWEKVDFIWYYEDVVTKRPVYWVFYTGYSAHVMTFEVGKVLEDDGWQAPVYCFQDEDEKMSINESQVIRKISSI
ncbi:uncharacterized protein At4g14100-like [Impatiens glandulifera]|uniref:uncharacterized protein At4g14100-like n=1 Tax=Impatiens glandulifera TaxID=253017 RepID=UPI001FB076A1|nr:uncharacterized protein At4g14100-like [Impatiens glandulifera]